MKLWITFGGSSETPTTFYTGTGVGANAEDGVPILIARRQTTATTYAWAVALTGAAPAPVVTPVRVTPRTTPAAPRQGRGWEENAPLQQEERASVS